MVPLLASFQNSKPLIIEPRSLHLYADDTNYTSATNTATVELSFNQDILKLSSWFSSNYLAVNHTNSQDMVLRNSLQSMNLLFISLILLLKSKAFWRFFELTLTISRPFKTTYYLATLLQEGLFQNSFEEIKKISACWHCTIVVQSYMLAPLVYCSPLR